MLFSATIWASWGLRRTNSFTYGSGVWMFTTVPAFGFQNASHSASAPSQPCANSRFASSAGSVSMGTISSM